MWPWPPLPPSVASVTERGGELWLRSGGTRVRNKFKFVFDLRRWYGDNIEQGLPALSSFRWFFFVLSGGVRRMVHSQICFSGSGFFLVVQSCVTDNVVVRFDSPASVLTNEDWPAPALSGAWEICVLRLHTAGSYGIFTGTIRRFLLWAAICYTDDDRMWLLVYIDDFQSRCFYKLLRFNEFALRRRGPRGSNKICSRGITGGCSRKKTSAPEGFWMCFQFSEVFL